MGHTVEQRCCDSGTFWLYLFVIIGLLLFSGLMSGLTLGLMSLGLVDLEVIKKSGKPEDRKHAEKIAPVIQRQHLLLVTLLVGNAMAMEALPLFLDSLVDTWMAIVLSVTLLLMFGEILPQAVCSRYGLAVGAAMAPVVRVLLFVMFPIAWPVSKLLDKLLGAKHNGLFGRAELKTLVDMHSNEAGNGGDLSTHETRIIAGALELADKTARHAMTPIPAIVSVDVHSRLDDKAMMKILSSGYSRIPVYAEKPANIIGLIIVKNLLNITIETRSGSRLPVIDVPIRKIPWVPEDMPLYDVLQQFQHERSHMAAIIRSPNSRPFEDKVNVQNQSIAMEDSSGSEVSEPQCELESTGFQEVMSLSVASDCRCSSLNTADHEDDKKGYYRLVSWTDEEFKGNIIGIITREDVLNELLKDKVPTESMDHDQFQVAPVDQEFTNVSIRDLEPPPIAESDQQASNFTALYDRAIAALAAPRAFSRGRNSEESLTSSFPRTKSLGRSPLPDVTEAPSTSPIVTEFSQKTKVSESTTNSLFRSGQGQTNPDPAPTGTHSPGSDLQFQSASSSAPCSPCPIRKLGSTRESLSMNGRSTSSMWKGVGVGPLQNLTSRVFIHGQESPRPMSRQVAVHRVFHSKE